MQHNTNDYLKHIYISLVYRHIFVANSLTLVTIKLYKCNIYSTSCCIALQLIAHVFMLFCPPPVLNQSVGFVLQTNKKKNHISYCHASVQ